MPTDKVVGYIVALGGVFVALVAACVPGVIAWVNRRNEDDDDMTATPLMGMPVPIDHSNDAYDMLKLQAVELRAENAALNRQLIAAYAGWRETQSRLDAANRALEAAGGKPF